MYSLLGAYRNFRDYFAPELWRDLEGPNFDPSVFTKSELPVGICTAVCHKRKKEREGRGEERREEEYEKREKEEMKKKTRKTSNNHPVGILSSVLDQGQQKGLLCNFGSDVLWWSCRLGCYNSSGIYNKQNIDQKEEEKRGTKKKNKRRDKKTNDFTDWRSRESTVVDDHGGRGAVHGVHPSRRHALRPIQWRHWSSLHLCVHDLLV